MQIAQFLLQICDNISHFSNFSDFVGFCSSFNHYWVSLVQYFNDMNSLSQKKKSQSRKNSGSAI
jgi:hypothetical protein